MNTVSARGGFGWVLLSAMVFKRRQKQTWGDFLRGIFFPRRGWRRAFEYVGHRIKRLPDTPHKIALGFACGVFVSFSPLFGLHFIYAALCALLVRANMLAALLGTFFGNPLTFFFIGSLSYKLGMWMIGLDASAEDVAGLSESFKNAFVVMWDGIWSVFGYGRPNWWLLTNFFHQVFVPYFVGGILPGAISALICYFMSRPLIAAYQNKRRANLTKRPARHPAKFIPSADAAE